MKHIRQHLQKISKDAIKKGSTTLVILFFAMVIIFQKDSSKQDLQFIWNSTTDITHSAPNADAPASQRDYLFQNEAGNDVYQWQISNGQRRDGITPPSTTNMNTIDGLANPNQMTGGQETWQIYTGTIYTWSIATNTGSPTVNATWETITGNLDCITPWGEKIRNQDFILAYEQRTDVNTYCNIEKRICANGVLGGTFKQNSCKDNVVYNYRRAEIISYNQKILNDYIQPTKPINAWASFSTQGKINQTTKATDKRGTSNSPVLTDTTVTQSGLPNKYNCITPRGQTIKHGQFVKAYKTPRGFIDLACDVQIRPCVNGSLKWTFTYSKCTFNNTTYTDYLKAGAPKSNTGFLFFQRIKSVFN